ncbi:putative phosphatidylglycerol/phosphatidylinositol transfer protein DDB_G0282107 [Jatropha curcas]|uniref:putative phosphatidylglycerol/phosphatidylinositol transfer protein DDB_G0282107 n=1 Tax=Jatropha curcas TaxID=180498 RepID=UPI0005FB396F|nr:putative phosphatidylglycerol/phosphatidylinositol transfer protein DDB_G0282107 [Jatropha curcas]XP_037496689.1 putative phosphatidylglycerol/phosphatidylinositol transfer protein DDB_G0282107 [Jatropha curcas]XP_037496690.1 putative phosphatidylglycerol/phosphatidylinositol transfer protein DDB_G0282107 [Jatropha curcas]
MESVLPSLLKQTLLLLFAIYLLLPSVQATDVKYCDKKGNYAVKIHGVDISPDPVESGNPATFNISASTGQSITGGKVYIYVNFFSVRVHSETHDLCEEISCPIAPGSFVLSHTQTLPGFAPPGSYTLKVLMKDENDQELSCVSFNFKIRFGTLLSDN